MKIAIVGNGICGISAAKYISEDAPKEKLTIFTGEEYHYYPRPRLIQLLSEKTDLNQLFPYNDEWFKNKNIEVILGKRIQKINVSSKELILEDSSKYNYDKLLIANGSSPFVPPIEGVKSEGVFTLRNIKDVLRIREYSRNKRKAVVIGGGLLGLETARALNTLGLKVKIIEVASRLLPRQLDEEGAQILQSRIEKLGIEVILGTACSQILLEGTKKYLLSKEMGKLEADFFIISAGIRPN
ncbi:MAG: FAD-dependent oxidoreductase, partial [Candidatus Omnitrophota bacterium]